MTLASKTENFGKMCGVKARARTIVKLAHQTEKMHKGLSSNSRGPKQARSDGNGQGSGKARWSSQLVLLATREPRVR